MAYWYDVVGSSSLFLGGVIMKNNMIKVSEDQQNKIVEAIKMLASVAIEIIADNLFER